MNKFNKYCAEVMGYESYCDEPYPYDVWEYRLNGKVIHLQDEYNPYDDLNQMAEVVEKLFNSNGFLRYYNNLENLGIKQAFRDFIISTMPNAPT